MYVAAFLRAKGREMKDPRSNGSAKLVFEFDYDPEIQRMVMGYYNSPADMDNVNVRRFLDELNALRSLIKSFER